MTVSSTTTDNYPSGTLLLDTSHATAGETATITVTATDPTDGSTVTQSFTVTVGTYAGPTDPAINFAPFANPDDGLGRPGPDDHRHAQWRQRLSRFRASPRR